MGDHMNSYDFVELVNSKTRDEVVRIVEQYLDSPSVSSFTILNELSDWYNAKDDSERQLVTKLIKRVYDCAAWRILHLLDSGRDHGGRFELCFIDTASSLRDKVCGRFGGDELAMCAVPSDNEDGETMLREGTECYVNKINFLRAKSLN